MIFVDASALVAMLTREPDGARLTRALDADVMRITSPIAIYETVVAIRRIRASSVAEAQADVREFIAEADITIVSVTPEDGATALGAFAAFGKGTGHPAQLNMGDCFAYACTTTHDAALLFKGEDFSRTDIRQAL